MKETPPTGENATGIIMYEILFDEVPFYSESLMETYAKIMDHEKHFAFPDDVAVSDDALDIMRRLICKKEARLGRDSSREIQEHAWFAGFDWDSARKMVPPFVPELSGPDDTRYFEDEDNESKKLLKKPLAQTRAFTGQSLPFIGYTYLQDATAGVSWRIGGDNAPALPFQQPASLLIKRGSTRSMSGAEGSAEAAATRIQELMLARQTAENEARTLTAELAAERAAAAELRSVADVAERKRSLLENTVAELRSARERDAQEKDEIQRSLVNLKRKLEDGETEKADGDALRTAYARLEKENESLRARVREVSDDLNRQRAAAAEAEVANASLGATVANLQKQLSDEGSASSTKHQQLARELAESERAAKAELQLERLQSQQRIESLKLDLAASQAAVDSQAKEIVDLTTAKMQMEKNSSAATIELEKVSAQQQSLQQTIVELRSRQSQAANGQEEEVDSLRQKLTKASDKIAQLEKAVASAEIELDDMRKRIALDTAGHEITREKLKATTAALNDEQQRAMKQRQQMQKDSEAQRVQEQQAASRAADAERRAAQAEANVATLQRELEVARVEQKQNRAAAAAAPSRSVINYETLYFETQSSIEELHRQIADAKHKTRITAEAQKAQEAAAEQVRSSLEAAHRELAEVKARWRDTSLDLDALRERYSAEKRQATIQAAELADLRGALRSSHDVRSQMTLQIEEWRLSHAEATVRCHELEVQCTLAETQAKNLKERIHELEQTCTALHSQLDVSEDGSSIRRPESLVSADSKNAKMVAPASSPARSKPGWKNMLFRTNSQPFTMKNESQGRSGSHTPASQDATGDDITKYMEGHLERRRSTTSSFSLKSGMTKSSDALRIDVDTGMRQGLQGWLKVPKGGKVKKGWKMRYAVVRDLRLYMYDKDKDVGIMDGNLIADLRCDIFIAKIVAQNELIHANGKDIDCIFKIQSASINGADTTLKKNQADKEDDLLRRISKLSTEIALERKMLSAAEKMWIASAGVHRVTLEAQIESTKNRLSGMTAELERLREQDRSGESLGIEQTVESGIEEDLAQFKRKLEAQIAEEERKKIAVLKVAGVEKGGTVRGRDKAPKVGPGAESELALSERNIDKLKVDLQFLNSGDQGTVLVTLQKLKDAAEGSGTLGHAFKLRQYYKPTDCAVCHEPLWGGANQGLECTGCKMICHRSCKSTIDLSCQETQALATAQPLYFLAQDQVDRTRWLQGLEYFRREAQRGSVKTPLFSNKSIATLGASSDDLSGPAGQNLPSTQQRELRRLVTNRSESSLLSSR
ncbi:CDC42 binding protein kinase [Geranomyces michiganensis]|nr:CDC42 binding protein kinase [Geranomyces michiganensis]